MTDSIFERHKLADSFFRNFNCNPMILFVGRSALQEELEVIADCPWSCVITTRTDQKFSRCFIQNGMRTLKEYSSRREIPAKPLNRKNLPILRLFGVDGYGRSDTADSEAFLASIGLSGDGDQSEADLKRAHEMLQLLPGLLDCVSKLVVTGYQPEAERELPLSVFARILIDVPSGNVQLWDMIPSAPSFGQLDKIAQHKEFFFTDNRLADIIQDRTEDKENIISQADSDLYYIDKAPVAVRPEELMRYSYLAQLLTERTVCGIQPNGTLQYERWFSNFLLLSSSDGPQWYGYLPRSTFYVKRSYEDVLVELTRRALSTGVFQKQVLSSPIVLYGDSGSSKTITLGALAYRIYNEQLCPVIFIRNDTLLFYSGSQELEDLDSLMQFIEQQDGGHGRILLVWDCSSYRSGINVAQKLSQQLNNRGRRFVLVCSAYSGPENGVSAKYFRMNRSDGSRYFNPCTSEQAQVVQNQHCLYVKAVREMEPQEIGALRTRFREYSGIASASLKYWFDKLEKEEHNNNIFDYFYRLIALLRPQLEEGLSREQRKVTQYVNNQLARILEKQQEQEQQVLSPMQQAFLAAGFPLEEIPEDEPEDENDTDFSVALDRFNLCVAMFSQFKLDTPSSLAFAIFLGDDRNIYTAELFQIITTIPWLYYGESQGGGNFVFCEGQRSEDFVFRFRTPIEAEIFLEKNGYTGKQQVDLLCNIIDLYGKNYQKTLCRDDGLTICLQDLLRLMGPNSRYLPFQEVPSQRSIHEEVLRNLDTLIDKVWNIWEEYDVPDRNAGFASIAVTFTREFYGRQWDSVYLSKRNSTKQKPWEIDCEKYTAKTYQLRLERLHNAVVLANYCVAELEKLLRMGDEQYTFQHLTDQRDMLIVEIAQCNSLTERLVGEYRDLLGSGHDEEIRYHSQRIQQYPEVFRLLTQVINHQPDNGYAYNAVFKAFQEAYKREVREEKKLQYLNEIMQIVDTCSNTDVYNRGTNGNDEVSKNIAAIRAISNNFQMTIGEIKNRTGGKNTYYELYDRLLEANNPAAITFICLKELERADIVFRSTERLTDRQVQVCREVLNFMRGPDEFECICNNSYALALTIRVSWMCYNKTALLGSVECQLTHLKREEWFDICDLCRKYFARTDPMVRQPILVLLYALSELQTTGNFQSAIRILETLEEGQFFSSERMRTPFLICNEGGEAKKPDGTKYDGTVISTENYNGYIRVNGVPERLGRKVGVRFRRSNLGRNVRMPVKNDYLTDLELGIGYMGLSAYRSEGSRERRERT